MPSTRKLNFCANLTFLFQEVETICERYHLAAKAGFKAVESAYPKTCSVDDVIKAKNQANVEQVLLNAYVEPGDFGYTAIPEKQNLFRESVEKTIEMAKKLNCKRIHLTAGVVENPSKGHTRVYEENLQWAAKKLEAEKMIGVIEPINPHSLPNYFLHDYKLAVSILTKLNSPSLKLLLDIFHLQQLQGDLTHSIKWLLPYTGHIQIAQVPHRGEPNTSGEINYSYIFDLLEALEYKDWIGLEYTPVAGTKEGLSWVNEMKAIL